MTIKNNPTIGKIKLKYLLLFLIPNEISKYAKIEPAINSHPLVGISPE